MVLLRKHATVIPNWEDACDSDKQNTPLACDIVLFVNLTLDCSLSVLENYSTMGSMNDLLSW